MAAGRLILIEGMIGAGKSTTASKLANWLTSQGEDACVYHEFADDHPIRTKAVDLLRAAYRSASAPPDVGEDGLARDPEVYGLDQWARLASHCRGGRQTVILESAFLQNSVLPIFTGGAPVDEVLAISSCTTLLLVDPQDDWDGTLKQIHSAARA